MDKLTKFVQLIYEMLSRVSAQPRNFVKIANGRQENLPNYSTIFAEADLTLTVEDFSGNVNAGVLIPKGMWPLQFKKITSISGGNLYICY